MKKIEVELDSILDELKRKGMPKKVLDDYRKKFTENPDQEGSRAIKSLLSHEEIKSKVARKWK